MAGFRKIPNDKWHAEVMVDYKRDSKVFSTKAEAQAWAIEVTRDLASGEKQIPHKTFGQLLEKYRNEVSAHKAG